MMKTTGWSRIVITAGLFMVGSVQAAGAQQAQDVVGTWLLSLEGPFASETWTLVLHEDGGAPGGRLVMDPFGEADLNEVTVDGGDVAGWFSADMHGQMVTVEVSAAMDGDTCAGDISGFPMGEMAFTCERAEH